MRVVQTGILDVIGPGNGTVILVPETGISVVSDIDDVLRITKVYVPNQGLYNSFVQPYVNVPGVPELFAQWAQNLSAVSFHYDTTTPVELTRTYVDYLFSNFPLGSLEMRPINLTEPSEILDARQNSLLKLFQTFPRRKFGTPDPLLYSPLPIHRADAVDHGTSARRRHVLLNAPLRLPADRPAVPEQHRMHLHPQHLRDGRRRQDSLRHEPVPERQERHVLLLSHC